MDLGFFNSHRHSVQTDAGEIAYVDIGEGPTALFVHGVVMSSYLWRNVIDAVRDERRCIALDLPAHGRTHVRLGHDLSLPSQAATVAGLMDALDLGSVDVVANDTGGAIAQVLAANDPERLRTLTLTNCDAHDQLPPEAFKSTIDDARSGLVAPRVKRLHENPHEARIALGVGYERPELLSDETIREYFEPFKELAGGRELERRMISLDAADLLAVEPKLALLEVPTLIVWGTDDIFFDLKWAYWLKDAIAGAQKVVEIPGAKLFWPDERGAELVPHLREHWAAHAPAGAGAR